MSNCYDFQRYPMISIIEIVKRNLDNSSVKYSLFVWNFDCKKKLQAQNFVQCQEIFRENIQQIPPKY